MLMCTQSHTINYTCVFSYVGWSTARPSLVFAKQGKTLRQETVEWSSFVIKRTLSVLSCSLFYSKIFYVKYCILLKQLELHVRNLNESKIKKKKKNVSKTTTCAWGHERVQPSSSCSRWEGPEAGWRTELAPSALARVCFWALSRARRSIELK